MIPHPFGVVGLALNALGAVLLLWFPPTSENYTPDGEKVIGGWAERPRNRYEELAWRSAYHWERRTSRVALWLLLIGFVLQAVDLLHT